MAKQSKQSFSATKDDATTNDKESTSSNSPIEETNKGGTIDEALLEVEKANLEEHKRMLIETDALASELLKASIQANKKSEMSQLQEEINGLRSAISTLKNATAFSNVLPNSKKEVKHECGCGCDDTLERKCCIEIYGSGVRVLKASDGFGVSLELILAIQAAGVKAVFPGLTSYISVSKNVGWVKVEWSITKICVPCNQILNIPIVIEAMDLDKLLSVPEKGSANGSITIGCSCPISSVIYDVPLTAGSLIGEKNGLIMVEVSARKVNGCCC